MTEHSAPTAGAAQGQTESGCSCIVIPCYNEEARFPLDLFTAYADSHPAVRFLLVNDGSRDRTLDVLKRSAIGREDRVEVLDLPENRGKAEAVRAGMLKAMDSGRCRFAGYWDADMATPLEAIQDIAAVLSARPELEMVFGSRVKLLGRQVDRKAMRHYLGRAFATVVSVVLRLGVYDTQCGAKLFRVHPANRVLFAEPFISRWIFDVELIARFIRQRGYSISAVEGAIYEFPLHVWRDVAGSRLRATDFFRAFFEVLRIYLRYRS